MIEITTDRLHLRPPRPDDFDAFAMLWAEEAVNRYITGKAQTRAESWVRFERVMGGWAISGHGFFQVFGHDGTYLGQTGLFKAMRNLGPDFDDAVESGWVFGSAAAGKGFATEATLAAHRWFDAQPFAQRTVCMIAPDHTASIRVAEKCGYGLMRQADFAGDPVTLFERPCQSGQ